ncbi:MAG: PQQ-binding-like beta-propeller repeat protein [Proteobacteria bacterium]|nr:PQQ-binding-like beta-propeller repeat protein [Pseudomonadota bacterium]
MKGDDNGILRVLDARSGEPRYKVRLGDQGGTFSASPVAAGGKLYFTSEDGDVYVVKAGDEHELLATNSMGEICMATPAIVRDGLIIRTESHVFLIK